ncbi:tyrosine-type recombinase/integrase [Cupriavidus numazuensis]|uniref:Tyrosine recombinase XerC n=1 Tax=Cupriavidus numazuensis TaxID=221992 RepID=A0ABN7Q471_9BURK|nr:tyrosine-type recombinase/integrase [Cupriavidus numazuensis]CAG2156555.1 Tyrosine recombinase XerC [Cupriavidus numazuensis]
MRNLWLRNPSLAYAAWQNQERASEAARGFAPQSIIQHRAMLDRFHRHLVSHGVTVANFSGKHIEAFWLQSEATSYAAETRTRYLQLLSRLCRYLVEIGLRDDNPAADLMSDAGWSGQGNPPLYLPEDVDLRLQDFVMADGGGDAATLRVRAVVGLFLGTGITAAEGRAAALHDLHPAGDAPHLVAGTGRGRPARTIPLEAFAVDALGAWKARRQTLPIGGDLLFATRASGKPITDMSLGNIVREAFDRIGYEAADMSPRILRNTYCRRALLAGMPRDRVSELLGLSSHHTCDRIMATIRPRRNGSAVTDARDGDDGHATDSACTML